jgi:hypothetical protein
VQAERLNAATAITQGAIRVILSRFQVANRVEPTNGQQVQRTLLLD